MARKLLILASREPIPDRLLVKDIAILKLESSVPIQPIPILTLEEELQYAASGSGGGIAVGWGSTALSGEGGPMPETLEPCRYCERHLAHGAPSW